MLKDINEVFAVKEVALENINLLPECGQKVIYFVTAIQGETKIFLYIGFTINLSRKFKQHKRKIEFEFLSRIGYQINISWVVLPEGTREKEGQAIEMCYRRTFQPKLNGEQNSLAAVQAEESKKQFENREQQRYEYLKKQIENWEQSGEDKDTIIKKIWEVCKEPFGDKRLNSVGT
jgi:predicted GIY-YIG superfamily endonuclease